VVLDVDAVVDVVVDVVVDAEVDMVDHMENDQL